MFRSEGYRTDPFTNSMREIYLCLRCQEIGHHPAQSSSHSQGILILCYCLLKLCELGSSVSIVYGYGMDERVIRGSIPGRGERIFPLTSVSRPPLGPTQAPVQWVPGVLSLGLKHGWGVRLTTHPNLVPRLRMSRGCTSSPLKRLHGV
jgi:hypothetical protein